MDIVVTLYPRAGAGCENARDAGLIDSQLRKIEDVLARSAKAWIKQNALDRTARVSARCLGGAPPRTLPADLCVVGFRAEAYDNAAATLQRFAAHNHEDGATVHVVPLDDEPFDAELCDLVVDEGDGKWKVHVAPWDGEEGRGDRTKMRTLDIYDELDRLEVI